MKPIVVIPLDEIKSQFSENTRQDIKVIAPERLTEQMFNILTSRGKNLKKEVDLPDNIWRHSSKEDPNYLVESKDLGISLGEATNQMEIAFGNEKSTQDSHYHKFYGKILYSESHFNVKYRVVGEKEIVEVDLPNGGLIYIAPKVVHLQKFSGITLSMRFPMGADDKVLEDL